MSRYRVIIDADPGVDDAAAILMALASPEIDVLGLSVVAGNVPLQDTVTNACKIVGVSADPEKLMQCEATMQAALSDRASAARSQSYYLDITPAGRNKGTFVEAMATRLGVSPQTIATIGDMSNDLAMFGKSGLSFAMGNATDGVKARATHVTDTNDNDGFAKAMEIAERKRKEESARLARLRDTLESQIVGAVPQAALSGDRHHRLPSHLHISFPGIDGERLVFLLENRGVLVATGSACAANKGTRSHVLTAIGLPEEVADGSLRLSLGRLVDEEAVRQAGTIIIEEVQREYQRVAA